MLTETTPPDTGRSDARRRAIIDVAHDLFLAQGYAATSMSEIAQRLGGSKGTLYNYFRSKEELFAAFMADACQGPISALFDHPPPIRKDLRGGLIEFGSAFLSHLLQEPILSIHRLIVAESGRFPELGRMFYENGPQRGEIKLAAYFQQVMEAGKLRSGDPDMMGRWFKDIVVAGVYNKRLWGVLTNPTPAQIRDHTTEAVDIFLARFGPAAD